MGREWYGTYGNRRKRCPKKRGKIIGITTEKLREQVHEQPTELVVTKTLAERKALLQERADAFVLIPGGIGSLDEITDMLELKKHRIHNKPLIVLNTNNFYEGLRTQLKRMESEGFTTPLQDMILFADTPEEALRVITRQ